MENFSDIYTDVLDYINRPASELLARAKREVNNAMYFLQRKHMFVMSERIFRVTYPANTLLVDVTQAAEGTIRDYLNVQLLSGPTTTVGVPLHIKSYNEVLKERQQFQGRHESFDIEEQISDHPYDGQHDVIRNTNRYHLFLSGQNKIGLYPTPSQEVHLLFNCHIWLPKLEANNDTNFLLVYGYDAVLHLAVSNASHYLKEDRRLPNTNALFQEAYRSLMEWDASVRPPAV